MAAVSTVCTSSWRVEHQHFGPAEKQPSLCLKYCLLLGFTNGSDFQVTVAGIDS